MQLSCTEVLYILCNTVWILTKLYTDNLCNNETFGLTILYQWNLLRKHFSVFHKWWRTDGSQGKSTVGYYNNRWWCNFEIDSQSDIPTSCWITSSNFEFIGECYCPTCTCTSGISGVQCLVQWNAIMQFVSVCQSSTSSTNQAILSRLKQWKYKNQNLFCGW